MVSSLPAGRRQITIDIPAGIGKKFRDLGGKIYNFGGDQAVNIAQEMMGELGTGLLINLLGFTQSPVNWNLPGSENGPDNIAMNKAVNLWGIFEAKGGGSKLKDTQWGPQMSRGWLGHWIPWVYNNNTGPARDSLRQAFIGGSPMLAAVVRVDVTSPKPFIKVTVQKYVPPMGRGLWKWGDA